MKINIDLLSVSFDTSIREPLNHDISRINTRVSHFKFKINHRPTMKSFNHYRQNLIYRHQEMVDETNRMEDRYL